MKKRVINDNSFGVASVILGTTSVVLSLLSPLILPALAFAVIGFIFALIQNKHSKNAWSKWGNLLSIIGIILVIIGLIASYLILQYYPQFLG